MDHGIFIFGASVHSEHSEMHLSMAFVILFEVRHSIINLDIDEYVFSK